MNQSPLQKARYQYSPKLPGMLRMVFQKSVLRKETQLKVLQTKKKLRLYSLTLTEKKKSHSKREKILLQLKNKL